jgi:ABC-2 type transport system ATP-binding protein
MTYEQVVQGTKNGIGEQVIGLRAEGLGKRFGDFWALRGLDLELPRGRVLGLLGHNGAGKTTAIRILTTLSTPTEGRASVAGFDVATHGSEVRKRIGVTAQSATVDGLLSARFNLELIARLSGASKRQACARADALLELFDLTDRAGSLAKTFSGGMRRRLDLAASLVSTPEVLFLDEPTTGLDPRSRSELWGMLQDLVNDGTALLLTTQYLEEADHLAHQIVVLDHGRSVATGTPEELKIRVGGEHLDVTVERVEDLLVASDALAPFASGELAIARETRIVSVPLREGVRLVDVVRELDAAGLDRADMQRRRATLDDVFLSLTSASRADDSAIHGSTDDRRLGDQPTRSEGAAA